MKNKQYIRLVDSLIEFAQADLSNSTIDDKKKWCGQLGMLMIYIDGLFIHGVLEGSTDDKVWNNVLEYNREWKKALNLLLDLIDQGHFQIKYSLSAEFQLMGDVFTCPLEPHKQNNNTFRAKVYYDEEAKNRFMFDPNNKHKLPFKTVKLPVGFHFMSYALAEYDAISLRRCSYCSKIFFSPENKNRKYCSPKCRNIAGVKKHRLKDKNKSGKNKK